MPKPGEDEEAVTCERCGRCCLEPFYRHVAPEDCVRWRREGRADLLAAAEEEKRILEEEDSFLALKKFRPCRFNRQEANGRTACIIYSSRPRMCQEFIPGRSRLCPAGKNRHSHHDY